MKNTTELRRFLVEQMSLVAAGEVPTDQAKGVANIAQQICNTLNIEVKMAAAHSKLGDGAIKPVVFDE